MLWSDLLTLSSLVLNGRLQRRQIRFSFIVLWNGSNRYSFLYLSYIYCRNSSSTKRKILQSLLKWVESLNFSEGETWKLTHKLKLENFLSSTQIDFSYIDDSRLFFQNLKRKKTSFLQSLQFRKSFLFIDFNLAPLEICWRLPHETPLSLLQTSQSVFNQSNHSSCDFLWFSEISEFKKDWKVWKLSGPLFPSASHSGLMGTLLHS